MRFSPPCGCRVITRLHGALLGWDVATICSGIPSVMRVANTHTNTPAIKSDAGLSAVCGSKSVHILNE